MKPRTDDTVINLKDVRKRLEGEAKQTGKSIHDLLHELFGTAFGFPPGPYAEALQRQKQEAEDKCQQEQILELIKKQIVEPANAVIEKWKKAYSELANAFDKLEAAFDRQRDLMKDANAAIDRLDDDADDLRNIIESLTDAIERVSNGCGFNDDVITILQNDPSCRS